MEYPAFIQVNYVDTGEFDLTDPRRAHTAKYLESYMNEGSGDPCRIFSKLEERVAFAMRVRVHQASRSETSNGTRLGFWRRGQ